MTLMTLKTKMQLHLLRFQEKFQFLLLHYHINQYLLRTSKVRQKHLEHQVKKQSLRFILHMEIDEQIKILLWLENVLYSDFDNHFLDLSALKSFFKSDILLWEKIKPAFFTSVNLSGVDELDSCNKMKMTYSFTRTLCATCYSNPSFELLKLYSIQ